MTKLLDPRFRYIPAAATNVAETWKRFGFNAKANEQRRARQLSRVWDTGERHTDAAALRDLFLRVAAARMAV
jgi:hypothetical protein